MNRSELKPHLQLVAVESILFHENPQRRRTERLMEKIQHDTILRNPPIVAEMEGGDYLLLDGANRVRAMGDLSYSHIPVQVVDYGDPVIQLKGWHHLLIQGATLDLLASFRQIPGLRVTSIGTVEIDRQLELRQVYAIFVDHKTECWGLAPSAAMTAGDIFHRIEVLDQIVARYEGRSDLERIKLAEFSSLPEVIRSVQHQLLLFPVLTKEELMELARSEVMIPTGITRHLIPGRALGLNLDLRFLKTEAAPGEREAHFNAYLEKLEMEGRFRFYEESVFIMNE